MLLVFENALSLQELYHKFDLSSTMLSIFSCLNAKQNWHMQKISHLTIDMTEFHTYNKMYIIYDISLIHAYV